MEILSQQFLSALLAIIVIDLVLAGDNAIVIALAARTLPKELQKRAIVWGTMGAIAIRVVMTLVVVWLLGIPGLRSIGGLLLVWIAFKLLADEDSQESLEVTEETSPAGQTSLAGAVRTIVIADAVMGLDNVLGVAGAAKGSFLLVILGLAISIPIMIWGSTLILRWVERFPVIIYVGAGVLAWTAASMISHEPVVEDFVADRAWLRYVLYGTLLVGILGTGYWLRTRRRAVPG